jgi:hypothetical protein
MAVKLGIESSQRPPKGVLAILIVVLLALPAGMALSARERHVPRRSDGTLDGIAQGAGCRLTEFDHLRPSNPPIGGRVVSERVIARDGSYVGRRAPSSPAALHALMHGRVLMQYRPDLSSAQVRLLDRFVRSDRDRVLAFENQTGMPFPFAATAYLSRLTCRAVNGRTLSALRAFRDRRRGFGQAF